MSSEAGRLRIVSLNAWKNDGDFPARVALIAAGLAALSPDVICLQECFATQDGAVDVALDLAAALGLAAMTAPSRLKVRDLGGAPAPSTSGLAILAHRPLTTSVHELPSDPQDGPRIAQRVDLAPDLRVLNLHLTHLRGPAAVDLRAAQLAAALAFAEEGFTGALVVCGDLNATSQARELAALFADERIDRGPDPKQADAPTLHANAQPAIDHCVVIDPQRRWRIATLAHALRPAPGAVWPSDHAAVVANLKRV